MSVNLSLVLVPLALWLVLAGFGIAYGDGSDLPLRDSDGGFDGGDD